MREENDFDLLFMNRKKKIDTIRIIANILFGFSIASPILAFWIASEVGESEIFGVIGTVRYSWVMYFFALIPLGCFVLGIILKANGAKYVKHFVVSIICTVLILIFGSYRFVFPMSYELDGIKAIEEQVGVDLPDELKAATNEFDECTMIFAKVLDKNEKAEFEKELKENSLWASELSGSLMATIPSFVDYEFDGCDYFVYYNVTSGEYNSYQAEGTYEFAVIGYDIELGRIVILHECEFVAD
jgi:hypothetical protein